MGILKFFNLEKEDQKKPCYEKLHWLSKYAEHIGKTAYTDKIIKSQPECDYYEGFNVCSCLNRPSNVSSWDKCPFGYLSKFHDCNKEESSAGEIFFLRIQNQELIKILNESMDRNAPLILERQELKKVIKEHESTIKYLTEELRKATCINEIDKNYDRSIHRDIEKISQENIKNLEAELKQRIADNQYLYTRLQEEKEFSEKIIELVRIPSENIKNLIRKRDEE